ncbi:hypothetical protein FHT97_004055 [Rhizobium sp. BK399]|nr:hypothetical protein [Rhizobium sp. BK399]
MPRIGWGRSSRSSPEPHKPPDTSLPVEQRVGAVEVRRMPWNGITKKLWDLRPEALEFSLLDKRCCVQRTEPFKLSLAALWKE